MTDQQRKGLERAFQEFWDGSLFGDQEQPARGMAGAVFRRGFEAALTVREAELARYRIALVQIQHGLTKHTPAQIATAALRRVAAREANEPSDSASLKPKVDTERPDRGATT